MSRELYEDTSSSKQLKLIPGGGITTPQLWEAMNTCRSLEILLTLRVNLSEGSAKGNFGVVLRGGSGPCGRRRPDVKPASFPCFPFDPRCVNLFLHVGSQFELHRMRVQVGLHLQIGLIIFAHIMINQGKRNDQGYKPLSIQGKHLQQLLFLISA